MNSNYKIKPSLEEHLRQLEERLLQSEVRQSTEELDKLLADEFVEFGSSGAVYKKEDVIGGIPPVKMTITDFKAKLLAPEVVLTRFQVIKNQGSDKEEHSLRSSIWKQIQGKWQLVFHHGTPTDKRKLIF